MCKFHLPIDVVNFTKYYTRIYTSVTTFNYYFYQITKECIFQLIYVLKIGNQSAPKLTEAHRNYWTHVSFFLFNEID